MPAERVQTCAEDGIAQARETVNIITALGALASQYLWTCIQRRERNGRIQCRSDITAGNVCGPKIYQLHRAVVGHQHVGRLKISVHDTERVGVLERVAA